MSMSINFGFLRQPAAITPFPNQPPATAAKRRSTAPIPQRNKQSPNTSISSLYQFSLIWSNQSDMVVEGPTDYICISQNEFSCRKPKKQKDEDVAVCDCRYDAFNPDSACGYSCLNYLTSTECTPGYCACGPFCKNKRFQRCEYAKTRLFKTDGRGWGLLADEFIKAGQLIIEYCGEVISSKEAERRAQAYETQGVRDAYIITLNGNEAIDATRKGSLASQPNCVTRKWNVLGEIRVGIFAQQDISMGTELTYDYNFEWYGGAKVRCLCGAASCSGFLGAKSRGFQEDTYLWEDDDGRFSVEKIPLYDSGEDEISSKHAAGSSGSLSSEFLRSGNSGCSSMEVQKDAIDSIELNIKPLNSVGANGQFDQSHQRSNETCQVFVQKNPMISRIHSNSASRNYQIGEVPVLKKSLKRLSKRNSKSFSHKEADARRIARLFADKEAQEEILLHEEMKTEAASRLESLYNEIRPAIEEHERDSQDNVSTSIAERWIETSCMKLKAEFDLHFAIIKNLATKPLKKRADILEEENEVKLLSYDAKPDVTDPTVVS
ncbi:Histone-lysine N-methyltransferase ASHH1-like protein [Drosera capensis]